MSRSVRTFICYGAQTVEVANGDEVIAGRSTKCEVVLDDELASRHHCRILMESGRLFVEDLGSRNGVLVNGLEIQGRQELHHGDQITAGRSAITILRQGREPRRALSSVHPAVEDEDSEQVTGAGNLLDLLDGAARRALDEQDLMVAERTTLNLIGLLRRAAHSRGLKEHEVVGATRLALDLTEATSDKGWLGRVLELHVSAGAVMSAPEDARFVRLAESLGPPDRAVEDYIELARQLGKSGPVRALCEKLVS